MLEELAAIGYAGGTTRVERSGVTIHEREAVHEGLNFYSSGDAPRALLMDMEGRVLHTWECRYERAFPGSRHRKKEFSTWWRQARLLEGGDVIAIFEGLAILRLNRDSEILWASEIAAHHDLEVLPDGDIVTLTRKPRLIPKVHPSQPILEDFLTVLDRRGRVLRQVSLVEALFEHDPALLSGGKFVSGDLLHTNTVHLLASSSITGFPRGSILTSMNSLGLICVVDSSNGVVTWTRRKGARGQHDPQITGEGTLLYFDNREGSGRSAVVELDPSSGDVRWSYEGSEEHPLYSKFCGAVQRLDNGNTLITESDGGRAFEVQADGTVVWEFYNPERAGPDHDFIALIAKMVRLSRESVREWLD